MKENEGAILGRSGLSHDQQRQVWSIAREEGFTQEQLDVAARAARAAGTEQVQQDTLFGTETEEMGLWADKVRLAARVRKKLSSDRRFWSQATRLGRTGRLEQ